MIRLPETTETRSLTKEQIQHIRFLLQPHYVPLGEEWPAWLTDNYYSFMSLACQEEGKDFRGYCGYFRSDNDDDGFTRFYEPIPAITFYCCPNGFKFWTSRAKSNLISLQTIVIDIDAHNSDLATDQLQVHIKEFVPRLLDKLFFTPNFVSYTGRGAHFWYCIEPCHSSFIDTYSRCAKGLVSCFKEALSSMGESVLEVDELASGNATRLYRVPYSYNLKSGTWGDGEMLHTERLPIETLHGALQALKYVSCFSESARDKKKDTSKKKKTKENTTKKEKRKAPSKTPGRKCNDSGAYRGAFIHRKAFIEHLIETRESLNGQRNKLMFVLCHSVWNLTSNYEEYVSYIKSVNASLDEPLPEKELMATIDNIYDRVASYRINNSVFLEFCGATPEEIKYFNRSTEKKQKKAAAAKKKMDRNALILEMWDNGEKNVSYIAKTVGCSRPTVYSIVSQIPF